MYEPTLTTIQDSPRFILVKHDSDSIQPILARFQVNPDSWITPDCKKHNKIQLTIQYNHQTPLWIRSMRGWAYQRLAIFKLNFYLNECACSEMWKSVLQIYLELMILKKNMSMSGFCGLFEEKKSTLSKAYRIFKILIHLDS